MERSETEGGGPTPEGTPRPLPLAGLRVLDFSTLLPGPLATLMLAEAGAEVTKVERPGTGDEMRGMPPFAEDGTAVRFLLLNRGKTSRVLNLKTEEGVDAARTLAMSADVLVEQFRPGVMDRLGLGYEELAHRNERLVYCSITGYGQSGPKAGRAAHDLNYVAESGLLSLVRSTKGAPSLPPATLADIAGGSYPAFMNILLALFQREATGTGAHLDIAMADNVFPLIYWAVGNGFAGRWPVPNAELLTGGSPRYACYEAADHEWIAVAALEERFWRTFCRAINLDERHVDDHADPEATRVAVAARLAMRPAAEWASVFGEVDACCSRVVSVKEAVADPQVRARDLFSQEAALDGGRSVVAAMHVPIVPPLRTAVRRRDAPRLGGA